MMLEPAQRAGDAPHCAPEQHRPAAPGRFPVPLDGTAAEACRRAERAEWLRRRRLERQLHDGASLRISALTLQIGLVKHQLPASGFDLDAAVVALQEELQAALQELRDVADQIYPPLLDQAGLGPALREAAERVGVPVRMYTVDDRFGAAAEGAAYYAVGGCLDALDAAGPGVELRLRRETDIRRGPLLVVELAGVDVRQAEPMLEQVWRLGGTIDRTRESGIGAITVRIPCE